MKGTRNMIYLIDDDASVRLSLSRLLNVHGYRVLVFECAEDFLRSSSWSRPACLILDVQMPGRSGLKLFKTMKQKDLRIPVVFITGHGDIKMGVGAMKDGAVDFLPKPFSKRDLFDAIKRALRKDRVGLNHEKATARFQKCYQSLTAREREIMLNVVKGKLNKQIASDLGIAIKTVKIHRGVVMKKMKASSAIHLSNMAKQLALSPRKKE